MKYLFATFFAAALLSSCGSSKKLKKQKLEYEKLYGFYSQVQLDLKNCRNKEEENSRKRELLEKEMEGLNNQISLSRETGNIMVDQLKDLAVISGSQAESIKKSLEHIAAKDAFIGDLQKEMNRKDSLNMVLVLNLKGALKDINDQDIEIKVDKGVVFISISDKMLFKSGSYVVSNPAMNVLGKVAQILNSRPEIEFLVEGHTDNVPYKSNCLEDNWDLSAKRATSVVRILQSRFGIDPKRMTAGGRSEYVPVMSNEGTVGKQANRRTRIVILPELDQFFKLFEKP